jgi:hypothetical protein
MFVGSIISFINITSALNSGLLRGQEEKEASSTLKPDTLFSPLPYSSPQQS